MGLRVSDAPNLFALPPGGFRGNRRLLAFVARDRRAVVVHQGEVRETGPDQHVRRLARETAPDSAAAREITALVDELLRWPT